MVRITSPALALVVSCAGGPGTPTAPTTPSTTTSYFGAPFSQAGTTLATLDWDGVPAIAVGAPEETYDYWVGTDEAERSMGGFVLTAPFAGGSVQDLAVAAVTGVPYWVDEPVLDHEAGGWGSVSAAELSGDGLTDLVVTKVVFPAPFYGRLDYGAGWIRLEQAPNASCDVNADGNSDQCTDGGVELGPLTSDQVSPFPWDYDFAELEASWSVAVSDLDEDGVDEVVLGGDSWPCPSGGCTWVAWVPLHAQGVVSPDEIPALWTKPNHSSHVEVEAVTAGTDLDGDGADDIAAGAGSADDGSGRVWVLTDRAGGDLDAVAYATILGAPDEALGRAVATGDFDADGAADLAIGGEGLVLVFRGPLPPGPLTAADADLVLRGPVEGDQFGFALSVSDLDADGRDDLVVGAPSAPNDARQNVDGSASHGGAVHIVWGGGL